MMPLKFRLLIIQFTQFCNINCSYCYLPNRSKPGRMSLEVLEQVFSRCLTSNYCDRRATIIYHAGEPLVVPSQYYREAQRLATRYTLPGASHSHYIQTNGTLINEGWCRFFVESQFKVGVSIDGPAFLHDNKRQTRAGGETHHAVLRGIKLLQQYRIQFSVLAVVTKQTLLHAKQFHDFFYSQSIARIALNVEEIENAHTSSTLSMSDLPEYYQFISELWDLCACSGIQVREFELARSTLTALPMGQCHPELDPLHSLTFGMDGNFTAFAPELLGVRAETYNDFVLGNITSCSLEEAVDGQLYKTVARQLQLGVEKCRQECAFFDVCGGGNASNKFFENASLSSSTTMCCSFQVKVIMSVVAHKLAQTVRVSE